MTWALEDEKNFDRKWENVRVSQASKLGYLPASLAAGPPWKDRSKVCLESSKTPWKEDFKQVSLICVEL